ncbi:MAG: HlyD family secretion protein [Rubripirellula sp.]
MLLCRFTWLAFCLTACLIVSQAGSTRGQEESSMHDLIVVLIDEADVPAAKDGTLAKVQVREGETVQTGQILAQLDDREAQLQHQAAETELEIAQKKLANQQFVELAEMKLAQQEQLKRHHEITIGIATEKANNSVRVLASEKAEAVAKNELNRATQARKRFIDSVSQSEIDSLQLAHERTILETQQAGIDQQLDALQLQAEQESANTFQLGIERCIIERDAAVADLRIATLDIEFSRQKQQLAELALKNHQVLAPWDGVIVKRFHQQGEWVKRGEPVLRLIRLDRLRAEGYATADVVPKLRSNSTVQLKIELGDGQSVQREGEIVFISPELDPVNQERPFWIEFDNPKLDVLPGMRLSLKFAP